MELFHKRYHLPGTSPGTVTSEAGPGRASPRITLVDYDPSDVTVVQDAGTDQCRAALDSPTITWIHVQGDPDSTDLMALAEAYGLDPLAVEDVANVGQRAKIDVFEDQLFLVLALPQHDDQGELALRQMSFFLGQGYLISFCTGPEDIFEPVRRRLNGPVTARIRQSGADYLLYCLVDTVIDHGFPLMETYAERLESIEEAVLGASGGDALGGLHQIKRDLILLRRVFHNQRDAMAALMRQDGSLLGPDVMPYLRDCHDHCLAVMDYSENYRELAITIMEVYLTSVSNRMNDVMKVLTIIATIFIPLSFVAGVYGMNFDPGASRWNMPELGMRYGYPAVLAFMAVMAGVMLWLFRRRGWF